MHYFKLRKKYPIFIYEKFSWEVRGNLLHLEYHYLTPPDHKFLHTLVFENVDFTYITNIDNFVFHIGLSEMLSYWKAACSPVVSVPGYLCPQQITWWSQLFYKGMGEYFFKNQIDFSQEDFLEIKGNKNVVPSNNAISPVNNSILVPIGGGKDSAVTAEILHQSYQIQCFFINPTPASKSIASLVGCITPIIVQRTIDPYLLELNKQGFLNGHIPFSASIAFISLVTAVLGRHKYIALSNERSSNEGNIHYLGQEINHQYSKSMEFETSFNTYIHEFVTKDIDYFSFLRPLYEIQIAKLFSRMPHFFPVFRSCNKGQKTNSWCGHCPKCLSIALTLSPWTSEEIIIDIIGSNPLIDPSNREILMQMTGQRENKPFECVTTIHEAQIAQEMLRDGITDNVNLFINKWLDNPNAPNEFTQLLRNTYVA